jgi:hypothetical protein
MASRRLCALPPSLWTIVVVITAIIVDRQKRGKDNE